MRDLFLALVLSALPMLALAQTTRVAGVNVNAQAPIATVNPYSDVRLNPVNAGTDVAEIGDNDAETDGLEVRLGKHIGERFYAFGSATYGTYKNDPKWRLRAGADYAFTRRLSAGLVYDHVTSRAGLNDDGDFVREPGYDTVSAKLRLALTPHVSVSVIGNNVTNKKYFDGLAAVGEAADVGASVRGLLDIEY
jgi:outer membrane receptor protein involved in Fe transport